MTYVIDIDGTICNNTNGDYKQATPYVNRIKKINKLYDEGNIIIFLTARGMGRYNNDRRKAEISFLRLTREQLDRWGVKYHEIFLGKPSGDFYIDDKGIKDEDFFDTKD
jgi:capsule biosynthesis phosphatase